MRTAPAAGLWSPSVDARCGTLPKRLSEPALTLLLEEVKKGMECPLVTGCSPVKMMSATTIPGEISQAVGNAFPIFWECSSWECRGKRRGKRRRSMETSIKQEAREGLGPCG